MAHGGETILITRRGKAMAKLVPPRAEPRKHLADVQGWLEDDDPFFDTLEEVIGERPRHTPRVLESSGNPFAVDRSGQ